MSAAGTTRPALGPGLVVPKRRAFFGLLDADGWAWAGLKAFVWLIIIILLLGYIPDRAYYFTVNRTLDLGLIVWSPINFCSNENETLPCPAPLGALVPWHESPQELALPQPRTDGTAIQLGTKILYIGGSDGTTAQSSVYVAEVVGTGNFDKWAQAPELPEPRSDAAVTSVSGAVYVIGGFDADGAPTTTVYSIAPDPTTGVLSDWTEVDDLALPEARAQAVAVPTTDGMVVIGGEGPEGPVTTTFKSKLDAQGKLGKWEEEAPLARPQADALGATVGDFILLYGGHDDAGPVGAVQRGSIGLEAAEGFPENPDQGKVTKWDIDNAWNLPGARDDPAGYTANGTLYLMGGSDNDGPRTEVYWAIPNNDGTVPEWKHLPQSDLPYGLTGASAFVNGPNAVLVGGETTDGVIQTSLRANNAPQAPFFRLGPFGMTVPGLKIDGEIGQQLGYLNAAGAGTVDFVVLLIIGWAFAHKAQARSMVSRVVRRRGARGST
jgi:N-acetylneuraminic acid mutarotase